MKIAFLFLVTVMSSFALAEGGSHQAGIPHSVYWQTLNLVILFGGLIYFIKDTLKKLFSDRQKTFVETAQKSKKAEEEAEKQLLDIKHKLDMLNSTKEESLARAKAEAVDHKKNLMQEAQTVAERIKKETKESVRLEGQRAFNQLKKQTIEESIAMSRKVLVTDIGAQDHQKLQNDFSKNLSGVNP